MPGVVLPTGFHGLRAVEPRRKGNTVSNSTSRLLVVGAALLLGATAVQAQDGPVHRGAQRRHVAQRDGAGDRPLTIGGRRRQASNGGIIQVSPTEIYAPGGFKLPGQPLNFRERREVRKDIRNAQIRQASTGLYGYGVDGLGGVGFEVGRDEGYNNPNYGGAYNRYVGYNGVPTTLAFGPAFANRYLADHDPEDDDDEHGHPPAPAGLADPGTSSPFDGADD